MSVNRGLSLEIRREAIVAVAATGSQTGPWRLDALQTVSTGQRPGTALTAALAESDRRALLLMPNDRAGTAVTALPRLKSSELKRAVAGWVARETGSQARGDGRQLAGPARPQRRRRAAQDVFMVHARREAARPGRGGPALGSEAGAGAAVVPGARRVLPPGRSRRRDAAGLEPGLRRRQHQLPLRLDRRVAAAGAAPAERPLPGERPDEYLDRLATEVERSVFFARQTEASPEIERLVVCGDPALAGGLVQRLDRDSSIPAAHWSLPDHFESERAAAAGPDAAGRRGGPGLRRPALQPAG